MSNFSLAKWHAFRNLRSSHSALEAVDGKPYQGKASSEEEIVASSFGLIATFLRHAHDSQFFQEEIFEQLKGFLNSPDLSVLCDAEAVSTNNAAASNLVMKPPKNRHLQLSGPSQDTGCSLLTPPSSSKKVRQEWNSRFFPWIRPCKRKHWYSVAN